MAVQIRADVFPATLKIVDPETPDAQPQVLDRVRVVLTDESPQQVYVFQDASNGPAQVFKAEYLEFTPPQMAQRLREAWAPLYTTYFVTTPTVTLEFQKGSGCGCGSRLKSFNPFSSISALSAS